MVGLEESFDGLVYPENRVGGEAAELIKDGHFWTMVANRPPDVVSVPLGEVVGRLKTVPADLDLVRTARALNVSFGD